MCGICWLLVGFDRLRTYFILAGSIYFLCSNNTWQTFLLLGTTTVDYLVCLRLGHTEHEGRRRCLLALSLVSNIGMLVIFKYFNFLGHSFSTTEQCFGFRFDWVDATFFYRLESHSIPLRL